MKNYVNSIKFSRKSAFLLILYSVCVCIRVHIRAHAHACVYTHILYNTQICACECKQAYRYTQLCVYVHVRVWRSETDELISLLYFLNVFFFETGSHTDPRALIDPARLVGQQTPGSSWLCLPRDCWDYASYLLAQPFMNPQTQLCMLTWLALSWLSSWQSSWTVFPWPQGSISC